ncbi:hypothetical protein BHE74_00052166 [Ensete ventricosum]|nr:hypothetical protein BHE74_00052166 [Ensete ventricosum]RZS24465.1 hypothetical protein BHM03_00057538 [Ensete ventricosum]
MRSRREKPTDVCQAPFRCPPLPVTLCCRYCTSQGSSTLGVPGCQGVPIYRLVRCRHRPVLHSYSWILLEGLAIGNAAQIV